MTSILVRPAPGAATRAAVGALEITAASCVAHWLVSGTLPALAWIAASSLPVFGVGVLLQRGRVTLPSALAGAAVGQMFLHFALVAGTSADHMHAGGSAPALVLPMVVAHVVGALATVLVWTLRGRAWDVLVRVSRVRAVSRWWFRWHPVVTAARADAWLTWMGWRRRGPPLWV